ncbi:MAG: TetR/AcrR family transcriptional regulator [Myxococcales bacterium]|nr:TetR/AcrR family transcriptional regulator [Myxococcales bacterium]MCB9578907.1 TetR/AcrR family transcriptional regulator [Polyangiaceae bacterium]
MSRKRPADRFDRLVATATRVFIESGGFARTQIDDVARALGVAKGTVYLYVESKEALFDLALRHADQSAPLAEPSDLPVKTPVPGATRELVQARIREHGRFPTLTAALKVETPADVAQEVHAVLTEIYDTLYEGRVRIKLIATAARDVPDLAEAWFTQGRRRLNRRLARWIELRVKSGAFAPQPDATAAARMVSETLTWFAVHRHFEAAPEALDDAAARQTALLGVTRMLLGAGA